MLPLDLERFKFIFKNWVGLHVVKSGSLVDLLKAFSKGFIPSSCRLQKALLLCALSRCCFGHVDMRKSSTVATAFPLLLKLFHEHFSLF